MGESVIVIQTGGKPVKIAVDNAAISEVTIEQLIQSVLAATDEINKEDK